MNDCKSPYKEAGLNSRQALGEGARRKEKNQFAGVAKAYTHRKISKRYKPQPISLKASEVFRNW